MGLIFSFWSSLQNTSRPNHNMSNVKVINVKVGQNFQIQVPVSGFSKLTAVWMNGIKEIEDDTRVHLKVADDHVLLTNIKAERLWRYWLIQTCPQ